MIGLIVMLIISFVAVIAITITIIVLELNQQALNGQIQTSLSNQMLFNTQVQTSLEATEIYLDDLESSLHELEDHHNELEIEFYSAVHNTFVPEIKGGVSDPVLHAGATALASYSIDQFGYMHILFQITQTSGAGTSGSGEYLFPIPDGYQVDSTRFDIPSGETTESLSSGTVGYGILRYGANYYTIHPVIAHPLHLHVLYHSNATSVAIIGSSNLDFGSASGINMSFGAFFPVVKV